MFGITAGRLRDSNCLENTEKQDSGSITPPTNFDCSHSANTIKKLIESGAPLEFVLKKPAEEKTPKQVGAAWAAIREMANALGVSQDEMYRHMIRDYGKSTMSIVSKEDADRIIEMHSAVSDGNFGEIVGTSKQEPDCYVIRLWWGISGYNKEEMSAFLDGLVREHDEMFE